MGMEGVRGKIAAIRRGEAADWANLIQSLWDEVLRRPVVESSALVVLWLRDAANDYRGETAASLNAYADLVEASLHDQVSMVLSLFEEDPGRVALLTAACRQGSIPVTGSSVAGRSWRDVVRVLKEARVIEDDPLAPKHVRPTAFGRLVATFIRSRRSG